MGILATRYERLGAYLLGFANVAQAVPSLAVLGFALPLLGIGFAPAFFALVLRGLLPVFLNTYLGIRGVEPAIVEAAMGAGFRRVEVLTLVELPLASPVILAGVRTAAVEGVALATFGAFIGAGGLGDLILQGIALVDTVRLLAGAIPVALLAILVELVLGGVERLVRRFVVHA
ncbi:MAG: ABC transporter permease, partial [Alphaproteobacteria bacterium]|nr:ABC transporter permease [Alphaproteobacteria bacterium]